MVKIMNQLIVIENGQLDAICLDDRTSWEIGRGSREFRPDIRLHSPTVSRKHGKFQNMDGCWFYTDYNVKNTTVYNNRHIRKGLGGKSKPVMLRDGDVFVFGCGETPEINEKTIWALYSSRNCEGAWRAADTRGVHHLTFSDGKQTMQLECPPKGTVITQPAGMGIYMGDITYLLGQTALSIPVQE